MGFFAGIIRDSRQGFSTRALSGAGALRATPPPARVEPARLGPSAARAEQSAPATAVKAVRTIQEEGAGQSGGQEMPSAPGILQVVAPSSSEHPPATGLSETNILSIALSNPVTREQEWCESARTVTDGERPETAGSVHEKVSSAVSFVSVPDVPGHESLPEWSVSSARKMNAEMYGRREAGRAARAGATTPLETSPAEADLTGVLPAGPARAATAENVGRQVEEGGREANRQPGRSVEPLARPTSPGSLREGMPAEAGMAATSPDIASVATAGQPGRASACAGNRPPEPAQPVCADEPTVPVMTDAAISGPDAAGKMDQRPEEGQRERARQHVACVETPSRLSGAPELPPNGQAGRSDRPPQPPAPRVQIGLIEVVVLTPPVAERPRPSDSRPGSELASRHYLRNL